jgi:hypothetical protein
MAGWTLRSRRRTLVGQLDRVYVTTGLFQDRDTNLVIVPDADHQEMLVNLNGQTPRDDMFCEVQVQWPFRKLFTEWVETMVGSTVTARGVYVDDTGHKWPELHPLDLVAAPITSSSFPGDDWIARRADESGTVVGASLFAYRFAAASDTRKGLVFDGPPLWNETRSAAVRLDCPPRPGVEPEWHAVRDFRILFFDDAHADFDIVGAGSVPKLKIEVTCKAKGDGGPGVTLGEAVTLWSYSLAR